MNENIWNNHNIPLCNNIYYIKTRKISKHTLHAQYIQFTVHSNILSLTNYTRLLITQK